MSTLYRWAGNPDQSLTAEKTLKPCGTVAAYGRHIKRHEQPCQECRQARLEYDRAYNWRARKKQAA